MTIALRLYLQRNEPSIPLPPRPPPRDQAEANAEDIEDLRLLPGMDRSFSAAAKREFDDRIDHLAGQMAAMSPAEFAMAVSRLVALSGNAHTTVDLAQRAGRFGRVPVRFAWFADGLFIVRTTADFQDLLGQRVVSIDGRPVEDALSAVRPYFSGTQERARADSPPLMESPALLQTIWPETDGVHLSIGIENESAGRMIAALPPAPDPVAAQPIFAITKRGLTPDWQMINWPETPLALQEPGRAAYAAPLADAGMYIRINANDDDGNGPLAAQLRAILASAPAEGWRWMALDLRFNRGGDEVKTAAFTRALPDALRPDGRLFILTGNATFSAAIVTAARAKYFAGTHAHIVGETVGDRDRFWTTGGPRLILHNSGIAIGHAYFLHDWVNGCRAVSLCYPSQWIYGVAAGDLAPEVRVCWRFADYAAGRDTVLERARELEGAR